jgi:aquaporin Z
VRRLAGEALGTFCLVFAGTGAIIVDQGAGQIAGGAVTHVGVSLTFGLVVMAMIYALGDASGAHLNPAVTIAFACAKRFAPRDVPGYVVAQIVGACAASALLRVLFPRSETLGATIPAGPHWQSLGLEVVLTFMLMLVILAVSSGPKEQGIMAGIAVGGVVALEALFAGPVSGASMNPARSLAPALASGRLNELWIYLLAPTIGAALAVPAFRLIAPPRAEQRLAKEAQCDF